MGPIVNQRIVDKCRPIVNFCILTVLLCNSNLLDFYTEYSRCTYPCTASRKNHLITCFHTSGMTRKPRDNKVLSRSTTECPKHYECISHFYITIPDQRSCLFAYRPYASHSHRPGLPVTAPVDRSDLSLPSHRR